MGTERIQIIRFSALIPEPWRNGGGTTRPLAIGAGVGREVGEHLWRVSIADIERNGPFSTFPGSTRTLVGAGAPFTLTADGDDLPVDTGTVVTFDGDATTTCRITRPTHALNVMTRTGRCHADVMMIEVDDATELRGASSLTVAVVLNGAVTVAGSTDELGRFDAMRIDADAVARITGSGQLAVIEFRLPSD